MKKVLFTSIIGLLCICGYGDTSVGDDNSTTTSLFPMLHATTTAFYDNTMVPMVYFSESVSSLYGGSESDQFIDGSGWCNDDYDVWYDCDDVSCDDFEDLEDLRISPSETRRDDDFVLEDAPVSTPDVSTTVRVNVDQPLVEL